MKKSLLTVVLCLVLVSCGTIGKVTERQENGKFKATKKAETVKSEHFDLDSKKTLLIVPNGEYMLGMAKNLNYFERVITFEDFELEIIRAEKQEEVGSLSGRIGLSNAYNKYKPFLYIHLDNNEENANYLQLKLVNPKNAEELFVTEIYMDRVWVGVHDNNTFNPLFNGLIDYIEANSKTFNK
ncbi:hypothetical protein [Mesonia maritima]|uniref:Lipoprotein n=1 Tax=Mesonia maritima TaxID=1793873 RepID=A0ABU1K627_9FLAO|nr:hypothetical protein [Mesonia maritima]MDR6301061.1 hypothetical protein [Mesonia maritima]